MFDLIRAGGPAMGAVFLFGLAALLTSAHYAARPDGRRQGFLAWMSAATLWAVLAGVASDVAATLYHTMDVADPDQRGRLVLEGLAESMSPAIVGFALLAVVAFLAAVGRRRIDAVRP
jgi:hypothetical protein